MRILTRKLVSTVAAMIGAVTNASLLAQSIDTIDIPDVGPCPLVGTASQDKLEQLNRQKNRYTLPAEGQVEAAASLNAMLKPGDDAARWDDSRAAEIVGYVIDVQPGGVETCNCKTREEDYKDTHVAIVHSEGTTDKTEAVVVEVTPRLRMLKRKDGVDWTTEKLQTDLVGHWVRIRGWMLFDFMHSNQSENTAPGKSSDWRATAWEIHPITDIEVVSRPFGARVSGIFRTLTFRPNPTVIVDRTNRHAYVSISGQEAYPLLNTVEVEEESSE